MRCIKRLKEWCRGAIKSLRNVWLDIKSIINYGSTHDDDDWLGKELKEACKMATKYELMQKYYPNILARLEAAVDSREKKGRP